MGQGASYYYEIVAFVSVKIMPAEQQPPDHRAAVGPILTPVQSSTQPASSPMGTTPALMTTFTAPKLSN
jgi:hypothetical protein